MGPRLGRNLRLNTPSKVSTDREVQGSKLLMQWVVQDERQAPFRLATIVLDTSVQEGAKRAGLRVVETHHRHSEKEAQDACSHTHGKTQGSQGSRPEPGLLPSISWGLPLAFLPPTHMAKKPLIRSR